MMGPLERRLLNDFQKEFPVVEEPFRRIADRLETTEAEVLKTFSNLLEKGAISRIGAIVPPHRIGSSLLVALKVPESEMDSVADEVSRIPEVNHNYARDHDYNLWFVLAGHSDDHLEKILDGLESRLRYPMLRLPMLESFHIDLGFPIDFT